MAHHGTIKPLFLKADNVAVMLSPSLRMGVHKNTKAKFLHNIPRGFQVNWIYANYTTKGVLQK